MRQETDHLANRGAGRESQRGYRRSVYPTGGKITKHRRFGISKSRGTAIGKGRGGGKTTVGTAEARMQEDRDWEHTVGKAEVGRGLGIKGEDQ